VFFQRYRRRAILGLVLMISQAFFYNAIFFTYALVLTRFYGVADDRVGLYILPFALGNFLGPLVLGPLFDSLGRRVMIAATYALSAAGLAATGYAFTRGWLDAGTQTACWSAIFFFASAAASSAYLTVSEVFPLEIARGRGIAFRHRHRRGRLCRPALFGADRERQPGTVFAGYPLGAA
jgi:MFS family permease